MSESAVTPPCSAWWSGSTGARKRAKAVPCADGTPTMPATAVRTASTASGSVMTAGDSWM
jgi:hypothetical protein